MLYYLSGTLTLFNKEFSCPDIRAWLSRYECQFKRGSVSICKYKNENDYWVYQSMFGLTKLVIGLDQVSMEFIWQAYFGYQCSECFSHFCEPFWQILSGGIEHFLLSVSCSWRHIEYIGFLYSGNKETDLSAIFP